jgi:hypothetical protein
LRYKENNLNRGADFQNGITNREVSQEIRRDIVIRLKNLESDYLPVYSAWNGLGKYVYIKTIIMVIIIMIIQIIINILIVYVILTK